MYFTLFVLFSIVCRTHSVSIVKHTVINGNHAYDANHGYETTHGYDANHGYETTHGYDANHGYGANTSYTYYTGKTDTTVTDLSKAITAKIVGPVIIFNNKVAMAAGALPPLLALKGAIIGTAIATPIEIGAVLGSSIVSGVTGKLVAVPISVALESAKKFASAAEKGRHIWDFNVKNGPQILKDGFIKMGHIILKPIAVIVGAQTALTGAGIGITGTGIKKVGTGMEVVGAKMFATGLVAKGLGTALIKSVVVK